MKRTILALALTAMLIGGLGAAVGAQAGGFDLSWFTVDGGGAISSAGSGYTLSGTAGQPDAGALSGGGFSVNGGFWAATLATPIPTAAPVLIGHVTWQGRPAQPNAGQQVPITLTLKSAGGETNYPAQTTDARGYFTSSVAALPAGPYLWRVKNPKYLAGSGTVNLSGTGTVSIEVGLLKVGDANNDNVITVQDFGILKTTFGKSQGDPGYDDRADFSGDLVVSISDFNLLKGNFGLSGSPPVSPGAP
jgi:hypothetical protein